MPESAASALLVACSIAFRNRLSAAVDNVNNSLIASFAPFLAIRASCSASLACFFMLPLPLTFPDPLVFLLRPLVFLDSSAVFANVTPPSYYGNEQYFGDGPEESNLRVRVKLPFTLYPEQKMDARYLRCIDAIMDVFSAEDLSYAVQPPGYFVKTPDHSSL